jgi:ABC-2 type transport system ATP-binding protein
MRSISCTGYKRKVSLSLPATQKQPVSKSPMAIEVNNLTKAFKQGNTTVNALDSVSFNVSKGNVFTILGPNGAGKTTLLKILTTVMRPGSGTVLIDGYNIQTETHQVRKKIGVVAQGTHFDKYLSVWQNLVLHAQLHGLHKPQYEKRISALLEEMDLFVRRHDYMDTFSGGMQRRVSLIRALIHQPDLLFLDEPSTGLDPSARKEIWHSILLLRPHTTVILTTHYMEEADQLSDEIMILDKGHVVLQGSATELKNHLSPPNVYELQLQTPTANQYYPLLSHLSGQLSVLSPYCLQIPMSGSQGSLAAAIQYVGEHVAPTDFQSFGLTRADLETVYLSIAGKTIPVSSVSGEKDDTRP